jgi:UDP-2,3-diacylglucosamine pyrophosphatase LpxH
VIRAVASRSEPASVLFIGDLHLDNPKTDRAALKRVLDRAVADKAAIFILGDMFDAMQGLGDRRGSKVDLAARYVGREDYLVALVEDVSEFLTPYAANIVLLLQGNHESSAAKHYGVHLEQLLAYELRKHGSPVVTPGYQTYAALQLTWSDKRKHADGTVPFWLTHGSGGGGPVTKGVIQAQRRAVTYPDARFVVSGHVHNSYFVAHEQHRLTTCLKTFDAEQEHYVVGAWKNEHEAKSGWWVERGGNPRLPSAWRASFWRASGVNPADLVRWEFTRVVP